MTSSEEKRFIFISNPKCGTTSIQKYLRVLEPSCVINRMKTLPGIKRIRGRDEHIKPKNLIKRIGHNYYSEHTVFTFIRDPFDKAISAYFFYKNGNTMLNRSFHLSFLFTLINIALARLLPFWIWVLVKPIRKNVDYVFSEDGTCIVNYIGRINHLSSDFEKICELLRIEIPADFSYDRLNSSRRDQQVNKYFNKKWKYKLFRKRYEKDIFFFDFIDHANDPGHNWYGSKLNNILESSSN